MLYSLPINHFKDLQESCKTEISLLQKLVLVVSVGANGNLPLLTTLLVHSFTQLGLNNHFFAFTFLKIFARDVTGGWQDGHLPTQFWAKIVMRREWWRATLLLAPPVLGSQLRPCLLLHKIFDNLFIYVIRDKVSKKHLVNSQKYENVNATFENCLPHFVLTVQL